jgi:hypothetical protein
MERLTIFADRDFDMPANHLEQECHIKHVLSFGNVFVFLLCAAYLRPWHRFQKGEPRIALTILGEGFLFRVFDCFPYNGESELLLIRLRTLCPFVTAFIMVFSNTSNSGREYRRLTFAPYESEIGQFQNQLRVHLTDVKLFGSRPWDQEHGLREYLLFCVRFECPRPDDLLIQSDLDEIPQPSALKMIFRGPPRHFIAVGAHVFYYSLRWRQKRKWVGNVVLKYGAIRQPFNSYRYRNNPIFPGFGAVHCSYCFPRVKDIIRKLQTSAHTEYGHGKYINPNFIVANVLCGRSLFHPQRDRFDLVPKSSYELNLPPSADRLLWRFPFTDLDDFNFSSSLIRSWAFCEIDLTKDDYVMYPFD